MPLSDRTELKTASCITQGTPVSSMAVAVIAFHPQQSARKSTHLVQEKKLHLLQLNLIHILSVPQRQKAAIQLMLAPQIAEAAQVSAPASRSYYF